MIYISKQQVMIYNHRWFSPVSPINITDRHDITGILLKVALNTINQTIYNHHILFCLSEPPVKDCHCHCKIYIYLLISRILYTLIELQRICMFLLALIFLQGI